MSVGKTASKLKKTWKPDPNITPAQLAEMTKIVAERIITARISLLLKHPFFGNMSTRLRVVQSDDWCPTAATDGRHLYYNTQFFNAMSDREVEFVIAHEIYHCIYDHMSRRENRNHYLYNVASDYIINNELVKSKIGQKVSIIEIFQDMKYDGWPSEKVYDHLFDQELEDIMNLGSLLDEHLEPYGDGEDADDGSGRPRYSRAEADKIKEEIREAMIQSYQVAGSGNTPAGIEKFIKGLTEPKMNWRELLRQQIQSTVKSDYTFARPSRKGWHMGAILPGMNYDETIDICVSLDMSGSIGDEQARVFLSEVKGIMEEYKDFKIKIMCFDTKVYNVQDFSADTGGDISDYKIKGGGGTDFDCVWNHLKEADIVPKKLIMFTDMYPNGSWGDEDYCDTIFINHGRPGFEAPHGVTAEYKP
jgi:predicted metal-dependent peptidase